VHDIRTLSGMLGKSSYGGHVNEKPYKTTPHTPEQHLFSHNF